MTATQASLPSSATIRRVETLNLAPSAATPLTLTAPDFFTVIEKVEYAPPSAAAIAAVTRAAYPYPHG